MFKKDDKFLHLRGQVDMELPLFFGFKKSTLNLCLTASIKRKQKYKKSSYSSISETDSLQALPTSKTL